MRHSLAPFFVINAPWACISLLYGPLPRPFRPHGRFGRMAGNKEMKEQRAFLPNDIIYYLFDLKLMEVCHVCKEKNVADTIFV